MAATNGRGPSGRRTGVRPVRRHTSRARIALLIAAAFTALALAACGSSSKTSSPSGASSTSGATSSASGATSSSTTAASSGPQQAGGSLTVLESTGFAGDWPGGLDPATDTNGAADQSQMSAIFGELYELGPHGLIPDLATGYTFSDGGKTVTLKIRKGVKFSDGTPFTAAAVAFNWNRDVKSTCTCKPTIAVKGPVTAPNPTTVVIHLALANGAFINSLQDSIFNWIASPTSLKKMGEKNFKLKPVGAGPFTVVSDTLSNQLVLKKNPNYWQAGHPYLDGLTFKVTQDDETALEAMQAGQGQVYEGLSTVKLVPEFQKKFTVTSQPGTSPYDIQLNTKIAPFNNIKARQAIYYATDTALIDEKLFNNTNPVGEGFTGPGGLFYSKTVPGYPGYNLAKAKALVKQLGGLTVNLFSINQSATGDMMVALQQAWEQAGIKVSIHDYPLATLIQQFQGGKWQAALQTAGAWDPAGGVGVGFRFLSTSPFSGVHDPKLDKLIDGGAAAVNPAKRKSLYDQAAEYIAKQADGPFLFPVSSWTIAAKGVQGPGITDGIPPVAVNTGILWPDVSTASGS